MCICQYSSLFSVCTKYTYMCAFVNKAVFLVCVYKYTYMCVFVNKAIFLVYVQYTYMCAFVNKAVFLVYVQEYTYMYAFVNKAVFLVYVHVYIHVCILSVKQSFLFSFNSRFLNRSHNPHNCLITEVSFLIKYSILIKSFIFNIIKCCSMY